MIIGLDGAGFRQFMLQLNERQEIYFNQVIFPLYQIIINDRMLGNY